MKPVPFSYAIAQSPNDAARLVAAPGGDVKLIGGGQSLGPMLNLRLARPDRLIDLSGLADLHQVSETDDRIVIGAAVTHARIEDGGVPEPMPGMLRRIAANIAYRAVRNRGTLGGSLAHADPAADWVTTMTALDAALIVVSAEGGSREIAMRGFMLGAYRTALAPGEVIRAVAIPRYSDQGRWGYHKICRKVGEFATAIGAVTLDPPRGVCRVVCGAVGGAPVMLDALAAQLAASASVPGRDAVEQALTHAGVRADPVKLRQLAVAVHRAMHEVTDR